MSSQAWPRSAAPHCSLPREGGSQGGGTSAPCTCSQGVPHLNKAENYSPRALQRIELFSLQTLPALASGCCHSRRGLVPVIYLNRHSGGSSYLLKHRPGVSCCGRRGGLFCYIFVAAGRNRNREENKERPGRLWLVPLGPQHPALPVELV